MFKNVASQKLTVLVIDTANNVPKTGDSANLTCYVSKDDGAVTVLGDTSATELDATNAPGLYSFDLTQSETNGDKLLFSGKSSTSGIRVVPLLIYTTPANFTTMSIDSNGRLDVIKIAGTSQTARDIGASVLLSSGTGTGQLDFTSGVVKSNVTQYGGSNGTFASGRPEVNVSHFGGTAGTFSGGRAEVNTSHAAGTAWNSGAIVAATIATDAIDADSIKADAVTKIQSGLATAAALAIVAAYIDTEVADIKAKTDTLPSSPASTGDIPTAAAILSAMWSKVIGYGSLTFENCMVIAVSLLAAKNSGMASGTVTVRDADNTKDVAVIVLDTDNNRTTVTLTP